MNEPSVFDTDRRVRLGIWGLGRGAGFAATCKALSIDVVAGCERYEPAREAFRAAVPGVRVTADAEEFLSWEFDAVLLATYCPDHGAHAVQCLEAGKHVLSEVTSFQTPAEGVALVETVERTGLIYNLAENYPFTKPRLYLARRFREGFFGDLEYAENEYNHDSRRPLSFRYNGGGPVRPGHSLHGWRSWQHQHFYSTHSLGPIMHITGARPTRVVSLPGQNSMAANVSQVASAKMATVAPSLLTMSDGGLVRNFMGSTPNDSHLLRLWGTKAAAVYDGDLSLRVGGKGEGTFISVEPTWPEPDRRQTTGRSSRNPSLGELAESTGHGGGDFWVLYQFARQILFGEPAFWDVYRAADVTLAGICAYRSALERGRPLDVPDFRDTETRNAWRDDRLAQTPYDWRTGPFPPEVDRQELSDFTDVMSALIDVHATGARAAADILAVENEIADPAPARQVLREFLDRREEMREVFDRAEALRRLAPGSDGARMIAEMLELAEAERTESDEFAAEVSAALDRLDVRGR